MSLVDDDAVSLAVFAGFMVVATGELVASDDINVVYPCATAGMILDEIAEMVVGAAEDEDEDEGSVLISGSTSSANSPK